MRWPCSPTGRHAERFLAEWPQIVRILIAAGSAGVRPLPAVRHDAVPTFADHGPAAGHARPPVLGAERLLRPHHRRHRRRGARRRRRPAVRLDPGHRHRRPGGRSLQWGVPPHRAGCSTSRSPCTGLLVFASIDPDTYADHAALGDAHRGRRDGRCSRRSSSRRTPPAVPPRASPGLRRAERARRPGRARSSRRRRGTTRPRRPARGGPEDREQCPGAARDPRVGPPGGPEQPAAAQDIGSPWRHWPTHHRRSSRWPAGSVSWSRSWPTSPVAPTSTRCGRRAARRCRGCCARSPPSSTRSRHGCRGGGHHRRGRGGAAALARGRQAPAGRDHASADVPADPRECRLRRRGGRTDHRDLRGALRPRRVAHLPARAAGRAA